MPRSSLVLLPLTRVGSLSSQQYVVPDRISMGTRKLTSTSLAVSDLLAIALVVASRIAELLLLRPCLQSLKVISSSLDLVNNNNHSEYGVFSARSCRSCRCRRRHRVTMTPRVQCVYVGHIC